jgi:hypothetical protein
MKCYNKNKHICPSEYCNVDDGTCIKKIKSGAPRKTKLVEELGKSYYWDENSGLVGRKKDVMSYLGKKQNYKSPAKSIKKKKSTKKTKRNSPVSKIVINENLEVKTVVQLLKILKSLGIDKKDIEGTGTGGGVRKSDLIRTISDADVKIITHHPNRLKL